MKTIKIIKIIKIIFLGITSISLSIAGGYKIPEQSLNSMGLGASYVAHTMGADSAYYNPANMSFLKDGYLVDGGLTLAHLPSNKYSFITPYSGKSEVENILIPNLHFVSKEMENWRWGISLTAPAGLTKRWNTPYQKIYAEEFTLKNIEINPVLSYKIADNFSVAGGLRVVYSEGVINSDGGNIAPIKREMEGNSFNLGYNLAMTYKPISDINIALTYRSNVDLEEEGDANLYFGKIGKQYNSYLTVPLPAALNISISKTWEDQFTIELNYEKTYWSTYKTLDFDYDIPIQESLQPIFDTPLARDWIDSDTFRIGATININDKFTAMFGFAIDDTPVPMETIGFELPDSDARIYSVGFRYKQSENLSWGMAILLDDKKSRDIPIGVVDNKILENGGKFSDGGAILSTIGISYRY